MFFRSVKIISCKIIMVAFSMILMGVSSPITTLAATESQLKTKIKNNVKAVGEYKNWDGVSNVSQFIGPDGEFWFAYDGKKEITVVSTAAGVVKDKIKLTKEHDTFGAVCSDISGNNFYVVTGEKNTGDDAAQKTVFVSKYDSQGNLITTIGDDGSSSLASYYESSSNTKIPFNDSNCDVDVNGKYLAVNYGRTMYNGHQSNSVWVIDTETMTTVETPDFYSYDPNASIYHRSHGIYSSHSFGQRTIKFGEGFLFASEGDAYERAFTISQWDLKENYITSEDIFHFWIKEGSSEDMGVVNNNYAHMGDIAVLSNGTAAFAATSVKSLSSSADSEREHIFIQIFDPYKDQETAEGYITNGERSGTSGLTGTTQVTDYGVKWLTDDDKYTYQHPQLVGVGDKFVLLYERCAKKTGKIKGVYYMVLDSSGNIVQDSKKFKKSASLNPCEPPICVDGCVYWVSNKASRKGKMFVYKLKI